MKRFHEKNLLLFPSSSFSIFIGMISLILLVLLLLSSSSSSPFFINGQQQQVTDPHPIRISFFANAFFSPNQVCASSNPDPNLAPTAVDSSTGTSYPCTHEEDVLTSQKRDIILQQILPYVSAKLSKVLNVKWKVDDMMNFLAPNTTTTTTSTTMASQPTTSNNNNTGTTMMMSSSTTEAPTTSISTPPPSPQQPSRIFVPTGTICDFYSIPQSHLPVVPPPADGSAIPSNRGVSNADVVIYVSALPGDRSLLTWPAATARSCIHEGDLFEPVSSSSSSNLYRRVYSNLKTGNGRPVVATLNIPPASVHDQRWLPSTPASNDVSVKRIMKGVLQALGLSWEYFDKVDRSSSIYEVDSANAATSTTAIPTQTTSSSSANNNNTSAPAPLSIPSYISPASTTPLRFFGPHTLKFARQYFGCSSLDAVPFTNVSAQGVIGFDSRVLKDEVMGVSFKSTASVVMSKLSIAALVDTNNISYSMNADAEMTSMFGNNAQTSSGFDTMTFGVNGTCNFISQSCFSSFTEDWFCPSAAASNNNNNNQYFDQCAPDFGSRGRCEGQVCPSCLTVNSSNPSPNHQFSVDPFTGQLPTSDMLANIISCIIPSDEPMYPAPDFVRGDILSSQSRCFKATTTLLGSTEPSPSRATRCFVSRCDPVTGKVQLKVGRMSSDWITCQNDIDVVYATGYSGSIQCPKRDLFCAAFDSWTVKSHLHGLGAQVIPEQTTSTTVTTALPQNTTQAPPTPVPSTPSPPTLFTTISAEPDINFTTTPAPALPPNPTQLLLTFYASPASFSANPSNNNNGNISSCTPAQADSIMRTLIENNSTAISNALGADLSKLLLITPSELIVGTIRAVAPSGGNPTPAGFEVFVAVKPIPDIISVLTPYTSTFTTASYVADLTAVVNYTYSQHSCPLLGLRQGAASDVTPTEEPHGACFVNGDCGTTAGVITLIVVLVFGCAALVIWRVFFVTDDDLIVVDENGNAKALAGEENLNIFGDESDAGSNSVMLMPVSEDESIMGGKKKARLKRRPSARSLGYTDTSAGSAVETENERDQHNQGGENSSNGTPNQNSNKMNNIDSDDNASLIANAADAGDQHQPTLRRSSTTSGSGHHHPPRRRSSVSGADAAAGGSTTTNPLNNNSNKDKDKFDPYMPKRQATSYAAYFKQQQQSGGGNATNNANVNPLGGAAPGKRKRFHHSSASASGSGRNSRSSSVAQNERLDSSGYLLGGGGDRSSVMSGGYDHTRNANNNNQQSLTSLRHREYIGNAFAQPASGGLPPPSASPRGNDDDDDFAEYSVGNNNNSNNNNSHNRGGGGGDFMVSHNVDLSEATLDDL